MTARSSAAATIPIAPSTSSNGRGFTGCGAAPPTPADRSGAGWERRGGFEAKRRLCDRECAGAGLGDEHLGAAVVDVALTHRVAVGQCRIQAQSGCLLRTDRNHGGAAGAQVVEAVRGSHHNDLGVAHLALQAGAVLDHYRMVYSSAFETARAGHGGG